MALDSVSDRGSAAGGSPPNPLPEGWLQRWPWVTFLGPFLVYMLVGSWEPSPPPSLVVAGAGAEEILVENEFQAADREEYRRYPSVYTFKIVLTIAAMLLVWPGYRTFPWKVNPLAFVVGIVGVVLWIGLCKLDLEPLLLGPLGLADYFRELGQRPAFNPLRELSDAPGWAYAFLAIRLIGLALVVPVIEEFFLRGMVMRVAVDPQWEKVPFGTATTAALVVGTAVPMLMHPGELFASLVWFSLVSWLMVRTKNIWDCVIAHAVTNLLLGVYVITLNTPESWQLM